MSREFTHESQGYDALAFIYSSSRKVETFHTALLFYRQRKSDTRGKLWQMISHGFNKTYKQAVDLQSFLNFRATRK